MHRRAEVSLCGAMLALLLSAASASARDPYYRPEPGNQYVSRTPAYLYVVWSVPQNLAPFAHIRTQDELETYVARTAIFLCKTQRHLEPDPAKPCSLQLVRMNTNDEYTKSAAGGWKTVGKLVLPLAKATDAELQRALTLPLPELKALFTRFEIKHDRLQLPAGS
jgi:hypothetical protein